MKTEDEKMALFETKKGTMTQVPGVAECDAKLAQLAKQKQDVIYKVGLKYVENNNVDDAAGTIYAEEMNELEALTREMDGTEVRKLALQGLRKCEKCGNILVIDSAFCNKCGEKLAPLQVENETTQTILRCSKCGNPVESGAAFCVSCGNKI